jgi:hypothetical protein
MNNIRDIAELDISGVLYTACEVLPYNPHYMWSGPKRNVLYKAIFRDRLQIKTYKKWPAGGALGAIAAIIPLDAVALLINTQDKCIKKIIEKRL